MVIDITNSYLTGRFCNIQSLSVTCIADLKTLILRANHQGLTGEVQLFDHMILDCKLPLPTTLHNLSVTSLEES